MLPMRCLQTVPSAAAVATLLVLVSIPVAAQEGTITGRVLDSSTMQPLQATQISAVGTGLGVLTGSQGTFTIRLPAGAYSLSLVNLGYQDERIDGVRVPPGGTVVMGDIFMITTALALDPLVVTSNRGQSERASAAPSAVNITPMERIEERASTSPADFVKAMPGVDMVQTGLTQSSTVTRGFNNIFSGALLVLTDNRYARVPSLRLNAYNMIPSTPLDIERVEVVLGPAAALYGPNSANGVMHIITSSPIDRPGTSISLTGGNRNLFHAAVRQAWAFGETSGLKVSGQYFRGDDFEHVDSAEARAARADPTDPLIANRDFTAERFGGEVRYDLRPWDDPEAGVTLTYGLNQLVSSIELTGIGAGQAREWRYQSGQAQLNYGGLFVQGFYNASDAGDTYLLRTGQPIVDKSTTLAAQAQYAFDAGERVEMVTGVDYSRTT